MLELTEAIEEAKASYELAKSEEEASYYEVILQELRTEKQERLKNEFGVVKC